MSDLIDTTEMYLRTIFELEEEGIVPLRARIAERLHQSGPTVSQTVARMERDNLVHVQGDRHLELTDGGSGPGDPGDAQAPARRAAADRRDRAGLGAGPRRGLPLGARHLRGRRAEARRPAHAPTESPYGNPIPGMDELGVRPRRRSTSGPATSSSTRSSATPATVHLGDHPPDERGDPEGRRDDGHLAPGRHPARASRCVAEAGGLGVRLTLTDAPGCEIDREAAAHLFVSRV